jgi:SAM-dependent methyltransferase
MGTDYWTPDRVRLFDLAVQRSDFPRRVIEALEPVLAGCRSVLDVGAGVGALTVPLARRVERVTALEPSEPMRQALHANLAAGGLTNVSCVAGGWGEAPIPAHDLVLVANVAPIFDELDKFIAEATPLASRAIALMQNVGPGSEKFYLGELYPLLLGRPYPARRDYLATVTRLHARGVLANVRILEYDFDQPFASIPEATAFWVARLRLAEPEAVQKLERFLAARLQPDGGGVLAPMRRRSAVLWWPTAPPTR